MSLGPVHDDDQLLDRLGARLGVGAGSPAGHAGAGSNGTGSDGTTADDHVAVLLAALATDVDRNLPTQVDELATRALAAALAAGPAASASSPAAAITALPTARRRLGRVVTFKRSTSIAVAASMVIGSAGIAAAVAGDGVRAIPGVQALAGIISRGDQTTPTAGGQPSDERRSDLTRQLRQQVDRPSGPDAVEVARLKQMASALPEGGGPEVQKWLKQLDALLAKQGTGTATSDASATGDGSGPGPASTGSNGSSTDPAGSEPAGAGPGSDPGASEPAGSGPAASEPAESGPAESEPAESEPAESGPAEPGATSEPSTGKPSTGKPTSSPGREPTALPTTAPQVTVVPTAPSTSTSVTLPSTSTTRGAAIASTRTTAPAKGSADSKAPRKKSLPKTTDRGRSPADKRIVKPSTNAVVAPAGAEATDADR